MQFRFPLALAAALAIGLPGHAHEYQAGGLRIGHPYARTTVPGQPAGGAYMSIENTGKQADRLLGASSPMARTVEIHTMSMDGNLMRMREVSSIELKPSTKIVMKPGNGYHLMLMGLEKPLRAGDKFPLTLTFEKAGKQEVSIVVEDKPAGESATPQHKH